MLVKVKNYPKYSVDEYGNVYNSNGVILKPFAGDNGYLRVSLSNDTVKHKKLLVHRLVAEAFIPNPNNLPQVNHKDENKTNNVVENLEWCTALENLRHSKVIEKASVAKFQRVRCVSNGEVYESVKEACEKYGLRHSNIVACCNGRRNKCGGMKWEYA